MSKCLNLCYIESGDHMKIIVSNKEIPLHVADNYFKRLKGLMFKKNIDYALIFKKCNGIHTFFMKEEIDIILTDKNNNILYTYTNLKPWKIILPKKNVYNTYELPKGSITKKIKSIKITE